MNPGERIQMRLRVTNELNEPTEAILGISVVDQASLSLNQNEQVSLNTKFLLLSEVKEPSDLENADFYLGPSREAEQRLDLLLGTQGWRRFVTWDETSPSEEFKALIVKLLDLNGMDSMDREITDNQDNSVSDWYLYRQALQNSLERAWIEIRYVAVIAMGVWGVVFSVDARGITKFPNGILQRLCSSHLPWWVAEQVWIALRRWLYPMSSIG